MGAYSPAPVMTPALEQRALDEIVLPTVRALKAMGTPYKGVLYAGLMLTREGPKLIDDQITTLRGRQPVNPSGGLCSRGHPVGATGLLQICELVWQMRGEAGARQIQPRPKVTMAQNQGGLLLGQDSAVYGTTILTA